MLSKQISPFYQFRFFQMSNVYICNYNLLLQNLKMFHLKIECKTENVQKQSIIYVLGKYTNSTLFFSKTFDNLTSST